jgi:hypothetical protein
MSHHFDITTANQDISDAFCFAGPSDDDGPRTVIGMNASPQDESSLPIFHDNIEHPWDRAAFYELKLDLNDDFVEDITWRFTFPVDPSTGTQYVQIAQLNGPDATSRTAPGTIITPPNAPAGQVLNLPNGIKAFAGKRLDSFFTDIRVPTALRAVLPHASGKSADPGLPGLAPFHNTFMGRTVRTIMVELPAGITGLDPIQCWGSTAMFDTTHTPHSWVQVQRAAGPDVAVVFGNGAVGSGTYHDTINGTGPSTDLQGRPTGSGIWGMIRDQVTTVVKALETFGEGKNGQPTAEAYGAFVADTFLPDALRFTPGTTALWDPWNGIRNGKGLYEELASNFARMVTNTDFTTGLTQGEQLLDYFPYLASPQDSQ